MPVSSQSLLPRVKFIWRMFPKSVTRLGYNCLGCETCFLLLIGLFKVSGSSSQGNSAGNVWNYSGYVRSDSAGACFGYVDILFDISLSNCSSCGDVSISVFQLNYFLWGDSQSFLNKPIDVDNDKKRKLIYYPQWSSKLFQIELLKVFKEPFSALFKPGPWAEKSWLKAEKYWRACWIW